MKFIINESKDQKMARAEGLVAAAEEVSHLFERVKRHKNRALETALINEAKSLIWKLLICAARGETEPEMAARTARIASLRAQVDGLSPLTVYEFEASVDGTTIVWEVAACNYASALNEIAKVKSQGKLYDPNDLGAIRSVVVERNGEKTTVFSLN